MLPQGRREVAGVSVAPANVDDALARDRCASRQFTLVIVDDTLLVEVRCRRTPRCRRFGQRIECSRAERVGDLGEANALSSVDLPLA